MNRIMIILAATTALTVSAPAAAQYRGGANVQLRVDQLRAELQAGVRSGDISRAEAVPLREQLRQLAQLERRYSVNGLSGRERAELQHRINRLRQSIRFAARDQDGRWDRDDRFDRDGRFDRGEDRYERSYDRDEDDWDDRDDRWDDDERYDRDDVRDDRDRGLIGGVLDSVAGGGLRVGQRVSADLGPVPYRHRDHYRDGNGAYYRSDGRNIYEIDARTHVVVRIFRVDR